MKELCLVHANCQGDPLITYLKACPEFSRKYEVRLYVNYTRDPVPTADLQRAAVFLYQYLPGNWNDIASERLLAHIPPTCASLCIPNMFSKRCWPFWFGPPDFVYGDTLLDSLVERGLNKGQILYLYLESPLVSRQDLDGIWEQSLEQERDKEAHTPIKYLDRIEQTFRRTNLFYTPNHPRRVLTDPVGAHVLDFLALPPLTQGQLDMQETHYDECELPIHPQVIDHLGLKFVSPDTRYTIYGKRKTFAEFVENYVDCRLLGETDFVSYLRLR
jgi:hypothetical protein